MVEELNKGGAPIGNQNARKHGFYSPVLTDMERLDFELATEVEGLDDEIALFPVKIKSLVQHDPDNIRLIMYALNHLERLVRTKYNLGKDDKKGIKEAVANVLRNIALPVGIGLGASMRK